MSIKNSIKDNSVADGVRKKHAESLIAKLTKNMPFD